MSSITLITGDSVMIDTDGLTLAEVLEEATGSVPEANQVRVNGVEFLGGLDIDVADGSTVQVLSQAVASKGVTGA